MVVLTLPNVFFTQTDLFLSYYGLGIESDNTSEGVPSLELTENALFGALRCLNTEGSKFGCRLACLLKQINMLDT